jgi:hypothetical protein
VNSCNEITYYTKNYLNAKYEKYCMEILSEINSISKNTLGLSFYNINFVSVFDELIFIILYENDKYSLYIEEVVRELIYTKFQNLDESEVDFLIIRCLEDLNEDPKYIITNQYYFIANEIIKIINEKVISHLSINSGNELKIYLEKLKGDIERFAFSGPFAGDDYNINSYWEEFCFQIQYGEEYVLDIILEDIESRLYTSLKKVEIKDIIKLYTQTDEFQYEEYYCEIDKPLPSKEEMIGQIIPKMIEEIQYIASTTYVPDFSNGEDWDDED